MAANRRVGAGGGRVAENLELSSGAVDGQYCAAGSLLIEETGGPGTGLAGAPSISPQGARYSAMLQEFARFEREL